MTGSRPKKKRKGKAKRGFLSQDQVEEILALGVMAVALFLFLVLLPTSWLGELGESWFLPGTSWGRLALQSKLFSITPLASQPF